MRRFTMSLGAVGVVGWALIGFAAPSLAAGPVGAFGSGTLTTTIGPTMISVAATNTGDGAQATGTVSLTYTAAGVTYNSTATALCVRNVGGLILVGSVITATNLPAGPGAGLVIVIQDNSPGGPDRVGYGFEPAPVTVSTSDCEVSPAIFPLSTLSSGDFGSVMPAPPTTTTTTTTTSTAATTSGTSNPSAAIVTIRGVSAHVDWVEGTPKGSITVTGRVGAPGPVQFKLLQGGSRTPITTMTESVSGKSFAVSLALPATIEPGTYIVQASPKGGTSGGETRPIQIPRPRDGIVSKAFVSITRDGPPILALSEDVKKLWVRFTFVDLPIGDAVTVFWKTPDGRPVAVAVKPATRVVESDVGSPTPLPKGKWQAILKVNGDVVRLVTITLR